MNILRGLCVFILTVCTQAGFSQQLLLGKNPYAMNKSAVLELNSDDQGFLLPRITDTALINALTPPDGMVIYFVPNKQILLRTNGYWKGLAPVGNYITALTGDVTAAGPGSSAATVTGLRGAALPALSSGFLKYNGTSWFFDTNTYLTATSSTLQTVTTAGNTTDQGIVVTKQGVTVTQSGNNTDGFALYMSRVNDNTPNGYFIRAQNKLATTDLFTVDAFGSVTANSFAKTGGTASQFLKADGSVDNNTYLTGNQAITLNGDVTGSGTTAITTTIGAGKVTNTMLAGSIASSKLIGTDIATVGTITAGTWNGTTIAPTRGGTGLTTYTLGDLLYANAANTLAKLPGNTTTAKKFLTQTGTGTLSAAPSWGTIASTDVSGLGGLATASSVDLGTSAVTGTLPASKFGTLTGDVTTTAGSYATSISNGAVTYAKMQNVSANNKLLGRASVGAGVTEEISLGTGLSLSGTTLNVSALPNTSLANSTISLATGTTGTDVNFSSSSVALGGTITLNLPSASSTSRGLLTAADWNTFKAKGNGSVTSVGLSMPSIFSVSNSPVTTSGTLTASLASQNANLVFAAPNGSAGTPAFRSIAKADLPSTTVYADQANTFTAGMKQSMQASATSAGLNIGGVTADPSALASGDLWFRTDLGRISYRSGVTTYRLAHTGDIPTNNNQLTNGSGYLTGNQTITLTGDVTGSGTTGLATTIGNGAVTYGKIQNTTMTSGLLGRYAGTAGTLQEITLGTGLTLNNTTGVLSATNTNNGTVTSVSVASANGFAGTVATSSSTPAITLSTTVTGIVKGNGTALSAAVAGTDYVAPNTAIAGATKTKITYDSKGLVTAGADATTSDIAEGANLYYTDARVRAATLTGLSTATATSITATDNVLTGFGKLQGQINTISSAGYITNANVVFNNQSNIYTAGMKQVFRGNATNAGVSFGGGLTADPLSLTAGDFWLRTDIGKFKYYDGTTAQSLVTESLAQTLTNKAISGTTNTITNIGNSSLTNSTIGLTLGTTGTDASVSGSPASLGGSLTLNLPNASATSRGLLTNTDWSVFNNKLANSISSGRLWGRSSAGTGAVEEITVGTGLQLSGTTLSLSANSWNTTGNAGTSPAANFIGTTDNQALVIKTNNAERVRIDNTGNVGVGTATPNAQLDVNGDVAMRMGAFTASAGSNNDIAIGKSAFIRIAGPAGAYTITGIAGGYDGRMIVLFNSTDYDMTLTYDDALSTAANRIFCADNTNIIIKRKGCATLMYSTADSRWIVVSTK